MEDSDLLGKIIFYSITGIFMVMFFASGLGIVAWLARQENQRI